MSETSRTLDAVLQALSEGDRPAALAGLEFLVSRLKQGDPLPEVQPPVGHPPYPARSYWVRYA